MSGQQRQPRRFLPVREAARQMGLSVQTMYSHSKLPGAPFLRPEGLRRVLVNLDEYVDWLRAGGVRKYTRQDESTTEGGEER